jgi:phosphatidylglycerophosphatase A
MSFARNVATLGPVGYTPIAPATMGSAVVALIGWFVPVPPLWVAIALILAATPIAMWAANEGEKTLGHDARPIIVDELIGQCLALLLVPHVLWAFAASFFLFRVFDVWKPLGVHGLQRLPGGVGVVADDFAAGLIACGVFHLGVWGARALGILH